MSKKKKAKLSPSKLKDVLKPAQKPDKPKRSVESLGAHAGTPPANRKITSGTPWREKRRVLTEQELVLVGSSVLNGTTEDCLQILNSPDASMLEKINARLALDSLKGNTRAFYMLSEQIFGRIRNGVSGDAANAPAKIIIALPDNGRAVKAHDIIEGEIEE